jgi:hypothetical protein
MNDRHGLRPQVGYPLHGSAEDLPPTQPGRFASWAIASCGFGVALSRSAIVSSPRQGHPEVTRRFPPIISTSISTLTFLFLYPALVSAPSVTPSRHATPMIQAQHGERDHSPPVSRNNCYFASLSFLPSRKRGKDILRYQARSAEPDSGGLVRESRSPPGSFRRSILCIFSIRESQEASGKVKESQGES